VIPSTNSQSERISHSQISSDPMKKSLSGSNPLARRLPLPKEKISRDSNRNISNGSSHEVKIDYPQNYSQPLVFHDQGLVATKTLDFVHTVNVTLGLPVPRTSPDHGTAYSLAKARTADDTPMVSALLEAAAFVR